MEFGRDRWVWVQGLERWSLAEAMVSGEDLFVPVLEKVGSNKWQSFQNSGSIRQNQCNNIYFHLSYKQWITQKKINDNGLPDLFNSIDEQVLMGPRILTFYTCVAGRFS